MASGRGLSDYSGSVILDEPTRYVDIARCPLRVSFKEAAENGSYHLKPTIGVDRKSDGGHHLGVDLNIGTGEVGTGDDDLGERIEP